MNKRGVRRIAKWKCASALEQALSSGDHWTFTGLNNEPLLGNEELALCVEIRRIVNQLRGLKVA
jgi:hypothetical protein